MPLGKPDVCASPVEIRSCCLMCEGVGLPRLEWGRLIVWKSLPRKPVSGESCYEFSRDGVEATC